MTVITFAGYCLMCAYLTAVFITSYYTCTHCTLLHSLSLIFNFNKQVPVLFKTLISVANNIIPKTSIKNT